jgi:Putative zinc-finger
MVEISCERVWREISNYLEGETSTELRALMEEHFKGCKHCTAAGWDSQRNPVSGPRSGFRSTCWVQQTLIPEA